MGELLLCNYSIAAMPFYIDALSCNIYSLEELCYLIEHNVFLLEDDFFEEELFLWIEREVGAKELAAALREAEQEEKGLSKFVELLFRETGYWDVPFVQQLLKQIESLAHKSVLERHKMRADRYVENQKYFPAILEYRKILQMEEECKKNPVLCGNIWHNQGVAFARLFLFEEAKECFLTAYKYHSNLMSIHAALATCLYLEDEEERKLLAERYGVSESKAQEICEEWKAVQESQEVLDFETQLGRIFDGADVTLEKNPELKELLLGWQKEYQKNSRC